VDRKLGQFVLSKIIKIVATSCQILRLECTKFDLRPRWGSLQRSPDYLAGLKYWWYFYIDTFTDTFDESWDVTAWKRLAVNC